MRPGPKPFAAKPRHLGPKGLSPNASQRLDRGSRAQVSGLGSRASVSGLGSRLHPTCSCPCSRSSLLAPAPAPVPAPRSRSRPAPALAPLLAPAHLGSDSRCQQPLNPRLS
ncbi:hypothetical protein GCM10022248_25230 [Nonomuraea soli]